MKTFAFGEMCLYYGAFGAKGPAGAGQKFFRKFFKKVDFLGSWQMVPSIGTLSYFRDPFWDPCRRTTVLWNEAGAYSFDGSGG